MASDWILVASLTPLILAAIAVAAALPRLRRVLHSFEAYLTKLDARIDTARDDHNVWAARLEQQIAEVRTRAQIAHNEIAASVHGIRADLSNVSAAAQAASSKADDLAARLSHISDSLDLLARCPAPPLLLDSVMTTSHSDAELRNVAQSLAILRPLVPYPAWRTDAELHNSDLSYRLRRWFWQHFHDLRRDEPAIVPWHDGTRLRVFLGNDISAQIYIAGCWEPNEFAFLDRVLRLGMTFLDIGANDGIYTVFAAKRVGSEGVVWAFEPSTRELERLRFNLDLNQLTARVFPVALAECNGEAQFKVAGYEHEAHNTLGDFAYAGVEAGAAQTVALRRLDDVVADNPPARIDIIKMDVEGAEFRVLQGATATLQKYRPIIMFEVSESSLRNQGTSGAQLVEFVRAQGYAIHIFDRSTGLVIPAPDGAHSDNMVGVPEEKSLPDSIRLPWPTTQPCSRATL
jgi:FkbM family methyltransferase